MVNRLELRWWSAVAIVAALVVAACSSGGEDAAPTRTLPMVEVGDVETGVLAVALCDDAGGDVVGEPIGERHDLDADGLDEAVVSVACGDDPVANNGVFVSAPGEPRLVSRIRGDDLIVLVGASTTVAVVVPVVDADGADTGLVERLVHEYRDGRLDVVDRRQMTLGEYLAGFAPPERRVDDDDVVDGWRSGVALIESLQCGSGLGHGSGFLVAPDLVMTNHHVVDDAVLLRVEVGGEVVEGRVLASQPGRDLALVQLPAAVEGHVFELSADEPRVGEDAITLGFPLERDEYTVTKGEVSGVGRRFEINGTFFENAIQLSAPINPGNSGGPLLDAAGVVLGVNSAGNDSFENVGFAVPATAAAALLADPGANPHPSTERTPVCEISDGLLTSEVIDVDLPPAMTSLARYVHGINQERYHEAWDVNGGSIGADERAFERFRSGLLTSVYRSFVIEDVSRVGDRRVEVDARLRTTQSAEFGPNGYECADWHLRYEMAEGDDLVWRIEEIDKLAEPQPCGADVGD